MHSVRAVNAATPASYVNSVSNDEVWARLDKTTRSEVLRERECHSAWRLDSMRFYDVGSNPETRVLPEEIDANYLSCEGRSYCIATQYPRIETLQAFLDIVANKHGGPPVACVVAITAGIDFNERDQEDIAVASDAYDSDESIDRAASPSQSPSLPLFPKYFDETWLRGEAVTIGESRSIAMPSARLVESPCPAVFDLHELRGSDAHADAGRCIPVVHVATWPDFGAIGCRQLSTIVAQIRRYQTDAGPDSVPLLHCRAGVGRTGSLAAAMRLSDPNDTGSLESIVRELRAQRSAIMVQTKEQFDMLAIFAAECGKTVAEAS